MRRLVWFAALTATLVVVGLLPGASPASAANVCGRAIVTTYNDPGATAADVGCVIVGYEAAVGAGVLHYGTFAGVGAGAALCYAASVPGGVACINPQNWVGVDVANKNVFGVSGVCFYPYPCDYGYVSVGRSGVGAGVNLDSYGISRSVFVPL